MTREEQTTKKKGGRRIGAIAGASVLALTLSLAPAPPAHAFSSAAIVAAIMKVLAWMKGTLMENIKEGFERSTEAVISNQRYLHNLFIDYWQTPGSFCTADQQVPEALSKASETAAYNAAVTYTADLQKYAGDPAKGAAAFNQEFDSMVQKATGGTGGAPSGGCDPRIPVPIEPDGQLANCDQKVLEVQNKALTGFDPEPAPPEDVMNETLGVIWEANNKTNELRKSLAAATHARINNQYQQDLIKAYRDYLSKPTVEELEKMSAAGGVARDQTVLMQMQGQLLLNLYIEMQQQNRLLATLVAQLTEQSSRSFLRDLRNRETAVSVSQ